MYVLVIARSCQIYHKRDLNSRTIVLVKFPITEEKYRAIENKRNRDSHD
jgi:hypothetical protein